MVQRTKKLCSIDGCDKKHYARGWCRVHYERWKRNGDPEFVAYVKTETPGESFALRTEWQGDCLVWTGTKNKNGYGQIFVSGRNIYVHRYAWEQANGPIPDGMLVVRKYHCDPACVHVGHLRLTTK